MLNAGYSGTPLAKKLGFKDNFKVILINEPDYYFKLFSILPEIEFVDYNHDQVDIIHFFTKRSEELYKELPKLKDKIKKDGMIWVSWPKKASKVPTDLNDMVIREFGLETGLVDVKVCAVDEVWSGLKFVYRLIDR